MALSVASGSFLSATATGNFAVTGVGFQGKLLMFWGGRHATGLGSHVHAQQFLGFATSPTNRVCLGVSFDDAAATAVAGRTQNVDRCYREMTSALTTLIDCDFVSWDADGFTLNQVIADATASRIFYLVLGGSDLTNVLVGSKDMGTTDTDLNVTGLGFQPDLLLLAAADHFRTNPTIEGNHAGAMLSLGVARATTARWSANLKSANGATSPGGHAVFLPAELLRDLDPATTNPKSINQLASFDADGFAINHTASAAAVDTGYLWVALKGTYRAAVGTLLQKTSPGTQAYTGVGFIPEVLLFCSTSRVVSTTITVDPKLSLGIALSTSNRRATAIAEDNNDPSICDSHATETKCLVHLTAGTPVVDAEADLSSFDSDGFTLNWTTADAVARETGYLALASGVDAPPDDDDDTLLLLGVG